MKKPTKQKSKRTMRKNQSLRIRARKAKKTKSKSLFKLEMSGEVQINKAVPPRRKALWPNQAIPGRSL